jgi:hypothetical protein
MDGIINRPLKKLEASKRNDRVVVVMVTVRIILQMQVKTRGLQQSDTGDEQDSEKTGLW